MIYNHDVRVEDYFVKMTNTTISNNKDTTNDKDDNKLQLVTQGNISLVAQIDIHRPIYSRYINAGVMLLRNTPWTMHLLEASYRHWETQVFQKGVVYAYYEQDALCLEMQSRFVGLHNELRQPVDGSLQDCPVYKADRGCVYDHFVITPYGKFWELPKDLAMPVRKDRSTTAAGSFLAHLPGCHAESCIDELLHLRSLSVSQSSSSPLR